MNRRDDDGVVHIWIKDPPPHEGGDLVCNFNWLATTTLFETDSPATCFECIAREPSARASQKAFITWAKKARGQ